MPSSTDIKILAAVGALMVAGAAAYLFLQGNDKSPAAPTPVSLPTITAPTTSVPGSNVKSSGNSAVDALRSSIPVPRIRLDPPPDNVKGPSFPIATVMAGRRLP